MNNKRHVNSFPKDEANARWGCDNCDSSCKSRKPDCLLTVPIMMSVLDPQKVSNMEKALHRMKFIIAPIGRDGFEIVTK